VAVCVLALPLTSLRLLPDQYERETIGSITDQQILAYVPEGHISSDLAGYLEAIVATGLSRR
jgi:hypothetical protein